MIPITVVEFGEEEERLVLDVLRSGKIAQGPVVERLERDFARMVGVRHAIAVNNGTTSLVASLEVLDLSPGDEVLTSPFTFVATLNAILEAGATATFADIADDFTLDPDSASAALTNRTRVLMPVHLYGQPADMPRLVELASRRGLAVVEDAAQAHGATVGDRNVGSFGLGSFSFYATKNITTGEGGMITTDDDRLADRLRVLRNQGMRTRYEYEMSGHNYRMTDLQAALGIPQIDRYSSTVAKRRRNADRLSAGLAGISGLTLPVTAPGRRHVWHQYTVRIGAESAVDRDEFVAKLGEAGVGSGIYYPRLVFDYEPYWRRDDVRIPLHVPKAQQVVREAVSLPVHHHLTDDDLDRVVDVVRGVLKH